MTEFKVGDRVRCADREGVVAFDDGGKDWPLRVDCANDELFWMDRDGRSNAYRYDEPVILLAAASDELAELRAFKETALASGYVPPEPDADMDAEAVKRIYADWAADRIEDTEDAIREAIAWARANPR